MTSTVTISPDEAREIRETVKGLQAELEQVGAEFVVEEEKRGKGTSSDAELEAFVERLGRMHDEHLFATYLMLTDLVHSRLAGRDHDVMRLVKDAFLEIAVRWVPNATIVAGFAALEDGAEFDVSYLDEEAGDA